MHLQQVFINPQGRLRSGWRVLVFSLVFLSLLLLLSATVHKVFELAVQFVPGRGMAHYLENIISRVVLLVAALFAGYICTRWLEGLPWRAMGLSLHQGWVRDLLIGTAIGVASLALAVAMAAAAGGLRFTAPDRGSLFQVGQTLLFSGVLFIIAALAEEALFRGYPLQTLTRANMAWLAIFLTSVPFATVHLKNPKRCPGLHLREHSAGRSLAGSCLSAHA